MLTSLVSRQQRHRDLDAANEQAKGNSKIGSTLKGIGPAYTDKIARTGLRVGDILASDFRERYNLEQLWADARINNIPDLD